MSQNERERACSSKSFERNLVKRLTSSSKQWKKMNQELSRRSGTSFSKKRTNSVTKDPNDKV